MTLPVEEERYPALRITVVLLKVVAALVLVASIFAGIAAFGTNRFVAFLILVGGLLGTVSYWAAAELLAVLMDIEANTRALRPRQ